MVARGGFTDHKDAQRFLCPLGGVGVDRRQTRCLGRTNDIPEQGVVVDGINRQKRKHDLIRTRQGIGENKVQK